MACRGSLLLLLNLLLPPCASRGSGSRPPLHAACASGDIHRLTALLKSGHKPDMLDADEWTPIAVASKQGHDDAVRLLIRAGASVSKPLTPADDMLTPLHIAAHMGRLRVIQTLVEAGASLEARAQSDGSTPLLLAILEGRSNVVEVLLEAGASPNASDTTSRRYTPLHHAASAANGQGMVEALLKAGASILSRAHDGATPLHVAARGAHLEATRVLLRWGAPINVRDARMQTPLQLAQSSLAVEGKLETIRELSKAASLASHIDPLESRGEAAAVGAGVFEQPIEPVDVRPQRMVRLSWVPSIIHLPAFVNESVAAHLRGVGLPRLQPSVTGPRSAMQREGAVRNSESAYLSVDDEQADPLLVEIIERMHNVMNVPPDHSSPLQITRYREGQFYRFHDDSFGDVVRPFAFIIFLSTPDVGGELIFPRLRNASAAVDTLAVDVPMSGQAHELDPNHTLLERVCGAPGRPVLTIEPRLGDAVMFKPWTYSRGQDPGALHGSCPVRQGEKWIVQRWSNPFPRPEYYHARTRNQAFMRDEL
jgi:ankyrin repeat protein